MESITLTIDKLIELNNRNTDINRLLTTIQNHQLKTNSFGILLDKSLQILFETYFYKPFYICFDTTTAFIKVSEDKYISVQYLLFGDKESIYIDFNTLHTTILESNKLVITKDEATSNYQLIRVHQDIENNEEQYSTLIEAIRNYDEKLYLNGTSENIISKFIESKLKEINMTKSVLSEKVSIKYKTLINKLTMNTLTAEELLLVAITINIDLNELAYMYSRYKTEMKHEVTEEVKHISELIRMGFNNGIVPDWDLAVPTNKLHPLTATERQLIAEQLESGYRAGYIPGITNRQWQLIY